MALEFGGKIWYRELAEDYLSEVKKQNELLEKLISVLDSKSAQK